jgi:hypothetical protein
MRPRDRRGACEAARQYMEYASIALLDCQQRTEPEGPFNLYQ